MKVRPWVVGAACLACGVVSRVVFAAYARPGEGALTEDHALFLAGWFGVGLILLAVRPIRLAYAPGDPTRGECLGCVLWVVAAFASVAVVLSALPAR